MRSTAALLLGVVSGGDAHFMKDLYAPVMPKLAKAGVNMEHANKVLGEVDTKVWEGMTGYKFLKAKTQATGKLDEGADALLRFVTGGRAGQEEKCAFSQEGALAMVRKYYGDNSYKCTKDPKAAAASTAAIFKGFGLDAAPLGSHPARASVDCMAQEIYDEMGGDVDTALARHTGLKYGVQWMVDKIERESKEPSTLADAYYREFEGAMLRASESWDSDPDYYASRMEKFVLLYMGPLIIPHAVEGKYTGEEIASIWWVAFYGNIQWANDLMSAHGKGADLKANVEAGKALLNLISPGGALTGVFQDGIDGWAGTECVRTQMINLYTVWNWRFVQWYYRNVKPEGVRCAGYAEGGSWLNAVPTLMAPVALTLGRDSAEPATPGSSYGWLFWRGNILSGLTGSHESDCAGNIHNFTDIKPVTISDADARRGAVEVQMAEPAVDKATAAESATPAAAPESFFHKVKTAAQTGVFFLLAGVVFGAAGLPLIAVLRRRGSPAPQEDVAPADSHFVEMLDDKAGSETVQV